MDISNPRRVLAVSLEGATVHLTKVIKDLTGSHPEQTSTSIAGTTHNLAIKTSYYTAEVPIWLDLIASPEEWAESFLSPEAKEVLDVLGGLIVVFALPPPTSPSIAPAQSSQPVPPSPPAPGTTSSTTPPPSSAAETAAQTRDLLRNIGRVVQDGLGGWSWDGVSLALGVGEADDVDEWEELAAGCGLEFVQIKSRVVADRNEFGGSMNKRLGDPFSPIRRAD
ncbi:hypothetical protein Micbo1qcDRAFT_174479 [Microdochium bolleyi]|uniref:Uncharacterized protein n=1 Tax=Microdochium bolleyi TaxID=196109 RepID=A0A136J8N6_9PEZI|nr:hypothetical protein Micbo1qcDRAFT_174479 [Microdochium bolleyi]